MSFVISHLYREEESQRWVIQTNADHTEGVAKLASQFASEFGMATWGETLGSLHDKGKESDAFQQHIKKLKCKLPPIMKKLKIKKKMKKQKILLKTQKKMKNLKLKKKKKKKIIK